MDFVELLKRLNRDLYDSCDKTALPRFAKAIEKPKSLTGLLTARDPVLGAFPRETLRRLSMVYVQYENWRAAFRETRRVLAASKVALPDVCLQSTAYSHELSALERIGRMCQRAGYPDLALWTDAVNAHLALWNTCVSLSLKNGTATCRMVNPSHPDAAVFENHTFSKQPLSEIRNYTWLAARRGERAGILKITIELPGDALLEQTRLASSALGMAARGRNESSILAELVTDNLESTVCWLIDQSATEAAVETAQRAYMSLLETPPLIAENLLAVYIGSSSKPAGLAILSGSGELLDSAEAAPGSSVTAAISTLIDRHKAEAVVLPVSAPDGARLREAHDAVTSRENLILTQVLPAAVRDARAALDVTSSPAVLSAVVLGRRALFPAEEWSRVPAASLGLGEYSADLDPGVLNDALNEARLLATTPLDGAPGRNTSAAGAGAGALRTGMAKGRRLNPLVRTIRDLKAGMMIDGVITNLTRFGAFVNIGLSTEAMIHISQLSVEFVDEPSQIVRVGQPVNARVIEVVPEKSRIALSLIPAGAVPSRPERPGQQRSAPADLARAGALFSPEEVARMNAAPKFTPSQSRSERSSSSSRSTSGDSSSSAGKDKGEVKKSRHEALADLAALFKK